MVSHVLFPLGVRLSTWLALVAFAALAVASRDRRPLLATVAWLVSFEAAFQVASLAVGVLPLGYFPPVFFLVIAAITLPWLTRQGIRPDWRILAFAVFLLGVWTAIGLPINGHLHGLFSLHTRITHLNPTAEFLNETAKTLWALAFLMPVWREYRRSRATSNEAAPALTERRIQHQRVG